MLDAANIIPNIDGLANFPAILYDFNTFPHCSGGPLNVGTVSPHVVLIETAKARFDEGSYGVIKFRQTETFAEGTSAKAFPFPVKIRNPVVAAASTAVATRPTVTILSRCTIGLHTLTSRKDAERGL